MQAFPGIKHNSCLPAFSRTDSFLPKHGSLPTLQSLGLSTTLLLGSQNLERGVQFLGILITISFLYSYRPKETVWCQPSRQAV